MDVKRMMWPAAFALLAGGAVLADTYYVANPKTKLLEEPDELCPGWKERLPIDKEVTYDGTIPFDDPVWTAEHPFVEVEVDDAQHKKGWIATNKLWKNRSTMTSEEEKKLRAESGSEGAAAAARGFSAELENERGKKDPNFSNTVKKVDEAEEFVTRTVRGEPSGKYENVKDDERMFKRLSAFAKEGGLK